MYKSIFIALFICCSFFSFSIEAKNQQPKKYFTKQEVILLEKQLIILINEERAKYGLKGLKEWELLSEVSKEHSTNMAEGTVDFGHNGFDNRAKKIQCQPNISSVGENVAYLYGYNDYLKEAVKGWMESPGHRKNILGDYKLTGMGIAFSKNGRCYLTQLFANMRKTSK
ncbi:MAG: CAP domain-containing protein [Parachlamydiaceae bacterium]|nr:CAP domain-containing protein [Parachlamydiaceae bacterium]